MQQGNPSLTDQHEAPTGMGLRLHYVISCHTTTRFVEGSCIVCKVKPSLSFCPCLQKKSFGTIRRYSFVILMYRQHQIPSLYGHYVMQEPIDHFQQWSAITSETFIHVALKCPKQHSQMGPNLAQPGPNWGPHGMLVVLEDKVVLTLMAKNVYLCDHQSEKCLLKLSSREDTI